MKNVCVLLRNDLVVCPNCNRVIERKDMKCLDCDFEIRVVSKERIKNNDYLRKIIQYDLEGNEVRQYRNVYEVFYFDNKKERNRRANVINACRRNVGRFSNFQWKFADEKTEVKDIRKETMGCSIVQYDLEGNFMNEYSSIKEASELLGISRHTISNCCARLMPTPNYEYFFFKKKNFCTRILQEAIINYKSKYFSIFMYNANGELEKVFHTYQEAANELNVSATSISSWSNHIHFPSGKYEKYSFEIVKGIEEKGECGCNNIDKNNCVINTEYVRMKEKTKKLCIDIAEKDKQIKELCKKNKECEKKISELQTRYIMRSPVIDKRVHFMTPIEEFIDLSKKMLFPAHIYILCDENGHRYVGQSKSGHCSRIEKHYRNQKKGMFNDYDTDVKLYVERIIIGWKDDLIFNLDDAESYYIAYYDSYKLGYNRTNGNHAEYCGRAEKDRNSKVNLR